MSEPNPAKRKREAAARRPPEPPSATGDSALFLELMDCTEDAVLILGADLSILRANRGATFLTGYSEAELGEMSLPQIFLPGERRWVKAAIKDMGRRCGGIAAVRPRAGAARPIKFSVSLASSASGLPPGYLFVGRARNGGGRRGTVDETMERRTKMLESIGEPVFIVDLTSRAVLNLNKCAAEFSGYRPPEIVGKILLDFLRFGGGESGELSLRGIIDTAYARQGAFFGVVGFERKGGAVVSCDCYSLLMLMDDGRPEYMLVVMVDRTELERRELALAEFAARASRLASDLSGLARSGADKSEGRRLSDLGFTPRQIEIARLVFEGHPSKIVGRQLGISESTVKNHLAAMFRKLGASSRVDFLRKLVEERIWIA